VRACGTHGGPGLRPAAFYNDRRFGGGGGGQIHSSTNRDLTPYSIDQRARIGGLWAIMPAGSPRGFWGGGFCRKLSSLWATKQVQRYPCRTPSTPDQDNINGNPELRRWKDSTAPRASGGWRSCSRSCASPQLRNTSRTVTVRRRAAPGRRWRRALANRAALYFAWMSHLPRVDPLSLLDIQRIIA